MFESVGYYKEDKNTPGYKKITKQAKRETKAHNKKKAMAKSIVGMKDLHGGRQDANRSADSFARTKPVAK